MSYILDALRKSEQQRQLGTPGPYVLSGRLPPVRTDRRRVLLRILLPPGLLLLGVALGWLGPWNTRQDQPTGPAVALVPDAYGTPEGARALPASPPASPPITHARPGAVPRSEKPGSAHVQARTPESPAPPSASAHEPARPDIAFLVHSDVPAERRVMLNGEIYRQGDVLPGGIRLVEIAPDGVVLDYQGRRVRHTVR
ncbi:MAG TPA: general secretion pathway protein GspB [Thiobacillaceae bacterium]|nr:general secretion pathway protein GspB [Thiobacillaceae bacterium]HNU63541.1 general secretion pathway protein GspB [Thiobacillaceae bacterium]